MFRITNNSIFSIVVSLVYITFLNMVAMFGLTQVWPDITSLQILFRFPFSAVTGVILLSLAVWVMSPFKNIKKEKKKQIGYWGLIMYTCLAVIIYVYTKYGNMLFQ
jgi:hypothetical protein